MTDRFDVLLVEIDLLGKGAAGKDGLAGLRNPAKQAQERSGELPLQLRLGVVLDDDGKIVQTGLEEWGQAFQDLIHDIREPGRVHAFALVRRPDLLTDAEGRHLPDFSFSRRS